MVLHVTIVCMQSMNVIVDYNSSATVNNSAKFVMVII